MRKKLYSLEDAAAFKKRRVPELLESACRGEIKLCIRLPDQFKVYSVIPDTLEKEGFHAEAESRRRFGKFVERASPNWFPEEDIDHLVLTQEDCIEVASQSAVYVRTFVAGYKVRGHDPVQEARPEPREERFFGTRSIFGPLFTTHDLRRVARPTHPISSLRQLREASGLSPYEGAESFQAIEVSKEKLLITAEELERLPAPAKRAPDEWGRQLMVELVPLIIARCAEKGLPFDPMKARGTKEDFAALFYAWLDERIKEEGEGNELYSRFEEVMPETLAGYTELLGGGRFPLSWGKGRPKGHFFDDIFPEFRDAMEAYRKKWASK